VLSIGSCLSAGSILSFRAVRRIMAAGPA
jgi:hypothetical protein